VHVSGNPALGALAGMPVASIVGRTAAEVGIPPPAAVGLWVAACRRCAQGGAPESFEYAHPAEEGSRRFSVTVGFVTVTPGGGPRFCYVARDVTEQIAAQAELSRFASILEATTDVVGIADTAGTLLYLNRTGRELVGDAWRPALGGAMVERLFPKGSDEIIRREGVPVAMLDGAWQGELELRRADGVAMPASVLLLALRADDGSVDFLAVMARDITERKETEDRIRASLREKEALVREIHHRVKNNLQVVSSLLGLQAGQIEDPGVRALFDESRDRIKTIALLHERLYRSHNLGSVDFADFLQSLVSMVVSAHSIRGTNVRSAVEAPAVTLSLDTAIPLGLIVNELVVNALKHAFKDRVKGVVRVVLKELGRGVYALEVSDDGVGLPPGMEVGRAQSLGIRLVRILTAQLRGKLEFESASGTTIRITFAEQTPGGGARERSL
jgi:PAS domain S-box-containing protein